MLLLKTTLFTIMMRLPMNTKITIKVPRADKINLKRGTKLKVEGVIKFGRI